MKQLSTYSRPMFAGNPAFRVGIVQEQDAQLAKVRVVFRDYDEVASWWLPVLAGKTQDDKFYWMPDIGEQVVCLMDARDEAGAVLGAIYSSADQTPINSADKLHIRFKDGTSTEYDRAAHVLDLSFNDSARVRYDGGNHVMSMNLPDGASFVISANGARIEIDPSGNVSIRAGGLVQLGSGQLAGVARLGDTVHVHDDEGGTLTGTIVTASIDVMAG
jgi:phage baseplate assembly protein V